MLLLDWRNVLVLSLLRIYLSNYAYKLPAFHCIPIIICLFHEKILAFSLILIPNKCMTTSKLCQQNVLKLCCINLTICVLLAVSSFCQKGFLWVAKVFLFALEHVFLVNVLLMVIDILPAEQHRTVISEFSGPLLLLTMHVNQAVKYWGTPCFKLFCRTHVLLPGADLQKKMRRVQFVKALKPASLWVARKLREELNYVCQLVEKVLISSVMLFWLVTVTWLCQLGDVLVCCISVSDVINWNPCFFFVFHYLLLKYGTKHDCIILLESW